MRNGNSTALYAADSSHSGLIRFEVDKVSTLGQNLKGQYSPEVEVGGVPWRANVCKFGKAFDTEASLAIFLVCMKNRSTMWSIDVNFDCVLVNVDRNKDVSYTQISQQFNHCHQFVGDRIFNWTQLFEILGFVKEDKITVEIHFSIVNMRGIRSASHIDFTDPKEVCHDIELIFDGEKLYASKQILAVHSPVFRAMFYSDFAEKDKKEVELKDVNREEFMEMLGIIYPACKKITDSNVAFLLKLGDRFQVKHVVDVAEDHLISSTKPELAKKLLISDQYRLIKLQDNCLNQLKTTEDVQKIKKTPEYDVLSETTKVALLEMLFQLLSK